MGNSPRYVGFIDPPYIVTLTDDSGNALDLTGCTSSSFTLTMLNQNTNLAQQGVGVWTVANQTTNKGQASYQWTNADMATAGPWWIYTTAKLPAEPSPREFDPELILILPGTVGAGAAPPGVLPAPIAAALYFNVRDYGATPGSSASINTTAIMNAWTALKAAGGGVLYFPGPGQYQTADLIFQSFSNFTLKGDRGVSIIPSPNTVASPGQATHDVCIIADCTDFSVEGLTFDGQRDTIAGDQLIGANAASGQKNITVANGTKYVVGQSVSIYAATSSSNDSGMIIDSIAGNVLTLHTNLTNSYTTANGDYVTQYQTGGVVPYTVAGRGLGNEDAQNGLHLISCQRFSIRNCTAQNTWESPIKMGTGFATTKATDGCSDGIVIGNICKHGFDQGISVWNSDHITVASNWCSDAGWAGISFTHCSDCTAVGNVCKNNTYSPPIDQNEGNGIAVEGGIRVTIANNVCSGNNKNGVALINSPMFIGTTTATTSLTAGATTIAVASGSQFAAGSSHTIIDPNNSLNRETIYVASVSGTTVTLSRALRFSYANGASITSRYGEDCVIIGNNCAQTVKGPGIHGQHQTNLKVFSNDCSENGYQNNVIVDVSGAGGILLEVNCEGAIVEANTCRLNSQNGIFADSTCKGVVIRGNDVTLSGIVGSTSKNGIELDGVVDALIEGNKSTFNTNNGISVQSGNSILPARTQIIGNVASYNTGRGIILGDGGSSISLIGNKALYNTQQGLDLKGVTNSVVSGNQSANNGQDGLLLQANGVPTQCSNILVESNLFYDDQGSHTQQWGIREVDSTTSIVLRGNYCTGNNTNYQLLSGIGGYISGNVGLNPIGQVTAPTFPSSTVAATNNTGYDIMAFIANGASAITIIQIAGNSGSYVTTGYQIAASGWGSIRIPAGGSVKFTYAGGVPTWTWFGD